MGLELMKLEVSFSLQKSDPFHRFYVQCPYPSELDKSISSDRYMPADQLAADGWQLVQLFQPDPLRKPHEVYAFFQRQAAEECPF